MGFPPIDDEQWERIGHLLPAERGRRARPAQDNRLYLAGILDVLSRGCPWRDMDSRYGKWNSVYVRYRRWNESGVWAQVKARLEDMPVSSAPLRIVVVKPD